MDAPDPMERLSSAYSLEIDEGTKTRHLAGMSTALESVRPAPVPTGLALRRRLASALAAVCVVAAPVGMAVAAEDTVPGDLLYPMKQVTERVRAAFDNDVEATHRVEEVERLLFLRSPRAAITRAIERAESATSEVAESDALASRLESARRRLQEQDEEERREREATESRAREQDETDRHGEAEPQGNDPKPGTQGGFDEGPGNSGADSQQGGQGGGSATTTTPAQSRGSGEGDANQSAGGSVPGPSSQPGAEFGTGESPDASSGAPEAERAGTPDDPGGGSWSAHSFSTTVP